MSSCIVSVIQTLKEAQAENANLKVELEQVKEERDQWKRQAMKAERQLQRRDYNIDDHEMGEPVG